MIQERRPIDTDTKIYIESYLINTIQDIIDSCNEKWGDISLTDLIIEHEHIQVKCFGYDQYDPSDYIDYFVITKRKA